MLIPYHTYYCVQEQYLVQIKVMVMFKIIFLIIYLHNSDNKQAKLWYKT